MSEHPKNADSTYIVEWLLNKKELTEAFREIISQSPENIDWGSDTDFEIKWANLVNETEKLISFEFPHSDKNQQVEVVRMFARKVSQN